MPTRTLATFTLNGDPVSLATEQGATLLQTLREDAGVTSAKRGCNQGVCGACTVMVDGVAVRACLTLTARCEGRDVRTVEGLASDPRMAALQRQFVDCGAVQCGFCTPGMLVSAASLLAEVPRPDRAAVKAGLSGNLCRCTGYRKIVDAVCAAAAEVRP